MTGVILETLSTKKLVLFGGVFLAIQTACFLLGGLIAPAPTNVQNILATKCLDEGHHVHKHKWFTVWSKNKPGCKSIQSFDDKEAFSKSTKQIVFVVQFPLRRNGQELDMSRWFQNIISVLKVDVPFKEEHQQGKNPVITLDARLGYRNINDPEGNWTELAHSTESRKFECTVENNVKKEGYLLDCKLLPFFELGSCHHDFYLINIRIPVHESKNVNTELGPISDIWAIIIHQNGGFTKIWFSLKSTMFPVLLGVLIWFWRRIVKMIRPPNLLERTLFTLGITVSFLNCPIEWLSLWFNMPFMLLLMDIRQGIFYAVLLCFWIIFAGEHMMDNQDRSKLVYYWKHLSAVIFGCICLFVFEMCERGVQLTNPFYSIWATDTGTNLALAFIILAGINACIYFIFLCYMIVRVFRNIGSKSSALSQMSSARRKYYAGLIYRFKFLMLSTLLCAAITIIFFIISQVSEGHWKWGEENTLEYTSAFFTGVYGMWNIYILCLMVLYAPSYKNMSDVTGDMNGELDGSNSGEENVEFTTLATEASSLTAMAKPATD